MKNKLYLPLAMRESRTVPLRRLAAMRGIHIGSCSHPALDHITGARGAHLAREFNSITPEICLKWDVVHPHKDHYDFSEVDILVDFAHRHDMAVHGHTLIWHASIPAWVYALNVGDLPTVMDEHMRMVLNHCGLVKTWDVVNEAWGLDEWTPSLWLNGMGQGYVEAAYRYARQRALSDQRLYYNSHCWQDGLWLDQVLRLAAKGLLDGVGLQMHLYCIPIDTQALAKTFKKIAEAGLRMRITEMDVRMPVSVSRDPMSPEMLERQAAIYSDVLRTALKFDNFEGITIWGADDALSWINGQYPGLGCATLFDRVCADKPAARAVANLLA